MSEAGNLALVQSFIDAWSSLDSERLVQFFAPDGVYHNMPIEPVQGHDGLRAFIGAFLANWTETKWEVLSVATSGRLVFVEWVDRSIAHGKTVALTCCGVFELEGGKIKVWRDYFDMETYRRAIVG
ncbi:SnoaL-like domain-containing protein [Altererythrobacter sp. BO-6]|uniref:nuclear transport factor 2 family protein n=1 Tax=Altererythrobacter sp. BO-6 TaxID=2604537 RepID=UPI0013E1270C|nr:nuclear transport factor 2 family protein [Altererythrobacter sp. BO-6]QIG54573.1 SnoaL-like domain-containing protein [Altererythrobacter sp. BO-6]